MDAEDDLKLNLRTLWSSKSAKVKLEYFRNSLNIALNLPGNGVGDVKLHQKTFCTSVLSMLI